MAHYAELDENNVVLRVVVINNENTLDSNGIESEEVGLAYCKQLWGESTNWKKTSYNTFAGEHKEGGLPFRKNFAGIGFIYDEQRDAFVPPKPIVPSEEQEYWSFDEDKCIWVYTKPQPEIGVTHV